MRKLGEQWIEVIDGKKHMVKEVKSDNEHVACPRCMFSGGYGTCVYPEDDCPVPNGYYIKDLGTLNEEGLLPCPFCGEYPGKRVGNDNWKCGCEIGAIATMQQAIDAWNRRV